MQGLGFAIVGMVERLTRTGVYKTRREVVFATDPFGGDRAIYVDGELVCSMEEAASFDDCVAAMLERLGVDFDSQGRHMVGEKIQTFEAVEYDAYWPQRLEDAPLDARDYGPPAEPELEPEALILGGLEVDHNGRRRSELLVAPTRASGEPILPGEPDYPYTAFDS